MRVKRLLFAWLLLATTAWCATFGTVVTRSEKLSDIILDEARRRLYLVDATANAIDVYNLASNPPRAAGSIAVSPIPSAAALSRDGKFLFVTCYDSSSLEVVDLDRQAVVRRVGLDAKPEGVAVGTADGQDRVLIGTVGTSAGQSALIVYDPASNATSTVLITPGATPLPTTPPPNSNEFLKLNGRLIASADGRLIVGVNNTANLRSRTVFVFEVASGTVLAARTVNNASTVLAISPDGSRFMAGPTMFDTASLSVLAQQNASNAPFVFPSGNTSNFNLQSIQGGSAFSPDGQYLYSAFDIPPVQNPPAAANVSELLVNDPENMLIQFGVKMTENLNGKMVISSDGNMIYALSQSGFLVLPVGNLRQSPLAMPRESVLLLLNDQCGVTADRQSASVAVENVGGGRMTATVSLLQIPNSGPIGLGGTGAGGGGGAPVQIVTPPVVIGPGGPIGVPPGVSGVQASVVQTSPLVRTQQQTNGANITYYFNPLAARSPGTVAPHDFLIQSNEAVNIAPVVRVYQNNRNSEAKGTVIPVPIGVSASEGLVDMVADPVRQRLYIANSGLNRVEVFDTREQKFLSPIRVGQLPRSLALDGDGLTLYVANSGGEAISIIDVEKLQQVGRITFPPIPFNASYALVTPAVISWSMRGLQVVMSDGTLWKVVDNRMVPRNLNPSVFGSSARSIAGPLRTMASTPEGRYILLLAGSGMAYLYDAEYDDYIRAAQVTSTPIQGFFGPVAAGPNGSYFLVNGNILNLALTIVGTAPSVTAGANGPDTPVGPVPMPLPSGFPSRSSGSVSRPVSAVAAAGANQFLRFSGPIRSSTNQVTADAGVVELVDAAKGQTLTWASALESPLATQAGTQRTNINGRTLAVNADATVAYALTTSGLSILPLDRQAPRDVPTANRNGVVSTANYTASFVPTSLISVFGSNLGASASATAPLPNMLGGMCLTLDNVPLPLLLTSGSQVNAQLPPTTTVGRHSLVLRAIDRQTASSAATITVSRYAPAVYLTESGAPAIYHADGSLVSTDHPAHRDEKLTILASGLGPTKGGKVTAGANSPSDPLAVTEKVQVFFGNPGYKEAEQIVEWSGLMPGYVGIYQIEVRVPGARIKGEKLPVQLRIGSVNSPASGTGAVTVAVE